MIGRSEFGEIVRMSTDTIRTNKLRSGLTVLGIVIGVAVVIGVSSIGRGLDDNVRDRLATVGSNVIFVFHLEPFTFGRMSDEMRARRELTMEDAEALRDLPHVKSVSALLRLFRQDIGTGTYVVKYENRQRTRCSRAIRLRLSTSKICPWLAAGGLRTSTMNIVPQWSSFAMTPHASCLGTKTRWAKRST